MCFNCENRSEIFMSINNMKDVPEQCLKVIKPLHQVLCPLKENQNIDVQPILEEFKHDLDTLKQWFPNWGA